MTPLRQRVLDELQRRNYAKDTARAYVLAIKQFAEYFGKSPERLGGEEVRRFELHLLKDRKLAREYSLQVIETEQVARQSPVPLTVWPVALSAMVLSNYLKTNK